MCSRNLRSPMLNPVTESSTSYGKSKVIEYGCVEMQGWRKTMEDTHFATNNFCEDETLSFFAVYDGHGGSEVSTNPIPCRVGNVKLIWGLRCFSLKRVNFVGEGWDWHDITTPFFMVYRKMEYRQSSPRLHGTRIFRPLFFFFLSKYNI